MKNYQEHWEKIIEKLQLEPLQDEGGYFRRTHESIEKIEVNCNESRVRPISSAILFLITSENFSALHRLQNNTEIFHFYAGNNCRMLQISPSGQSQILLFGNDALNGFSPQIIVPKLFWQGLKVIEPNGWALMGTTVSPSFEFSDFELGSRQILLETFPKIKNEILEFTRPE